MQDKKQSLVPELRFPGFEGEWEMKKFGELCKTITPSLKLQSSNYLKAGKYPIVDQSQSLICGWTNDSKGLISNVPVIIFGDHTCVLKYIDFPFIQGADGVKILSPQSGYDSRFIYQSFLANPVIQDGYKRHFSEFKEKTYMFPSLPEQQKIAECLSSVDDLIQAEADQLQALKDHKKGLMQQLFPQEGETTPKLRFPGFEGEWEEKKLGEVADSIVVGFPFKSEDLTNDNAGVLILRGLSIGEGCIKHGGEYDKYYTGETNSLKKYILHRDDIVMGMDGSIGRNIALVTKKEDNSLLIQRVARIRISKYPLHLIYQQIMSQRFKDYVCSEKVGAVIAHISQKQIENFPILVAPQKAEQQKIAECLSSLDEGIAAQQRKVEALKEHKKGLMQKLFPTIN